MGKLNFDVNDTSMFKEDDQRFKSGYASMLSTLEATGRVTIHLERTKKKSWRKFAGSEDEFFDLVMKNAEKYVFVEEVSRGELGRAVSANLCAADNNGNEVCSVEGEQCASCETVDAFSLFFDAGGQHVGKVFTSPFYSYLMGVYAEQEGEGAEKV